ncbi:amidase [Novosphingobium sp.]|uniref:amidase n=1 Tax=Novosphingobium sp. TaxID=1874826 RepID=UPI0035B18F8F
MATRREVVAGGLAASAASLAGMAQARPAAMPGGKAGTDVLASYDAVGLAELVRRRKVSPTELLDAAIAKAEALNPRFNFMAQKHYDYARKAIAQGLPDGPFTGVPWLLKDLYTYIEGELTEGGSRLYKGYRATVTSELVRRHQRAGFVIFGKTSTPEYGLTGTTENKLTGDTRNPWNPAHSTGGSSGGAAAAVASCVVPAAHASDGGGSIRIPSSCCGLFGMKPSRGRVPMGPLRTEGWGGLSTNHAITRSVRDSAAILDATHGVEPGSRYGAPSPREGFLAQVGKHPGRLRVALMTRPISGSPVDRQCIEAAQATARLCESLGHHVEEANLELDAAMLGWASFVLIGPSLAADMADRAKVLGITPGPDVLEPISLAFAEYGKAFTAVDSVRANNLLQETAVKVAAFMQKFDVILTPTLAAPPIKLGRINLTPDCGFQEWGQRAAVYSPFCQLANLTGQPAMSVPLSMSEDGLPIGSMFFGRYGDEALLFRLAGQLERAAPWFDKRPNLA